LCPLASSGHIGIVFVSFNLYIFALFYLLLDICIRRYIINNSKLIFPHPLLFSSVKALAASKWKLNESVEQKDETQEVISWYNRVLGFHVKGGRGNWLTLIFCTRIVFSSAN